jgi:hypothetical protein
MPSAALHKHKEAGSALNPNQGCQQREARLITARGPADLYSQPSRWTDGWHAQIRNVLASRCLRSRSGFAGISPGSGQRGGPATVAAQVAKLKDRFGIRHVAWPLTG